MNNERHHDEHEKGVGDNQDDNGTSNMRRQVPHFNCQFDKHMENPL